MHLCNPTGRNTDAREVRIGGVSLFFSYQTLIAVYTRDGGYRSDLQYSRTTSKHYREMDVDHLTQVPQEQLQRIAELALVTSLGPKYFTGD